MDCVKRAAAVAVAAVICAALPAADAAGQNPNPPDAIRQGAPTTGPDVPVGDDPPTHRSCQGIPRQFGPGGNNRDQANAGPDPLFRRIEVKGVSDVDYGFPGALAAVADFDHDERVDVLVMARDELKLLLNRGCWRFEDHPLRLGPKGTGETTFGNSAIALANVFNTDDHFDIYISRGIGHPEPNSLLVSQGRFDAFREEAGNLGLENMGAYSRGASIGDVNGDGYLDFAVGADQIGTPRQGVPYQRLYVYDRSARRFADVGGTDAVPGFGGKPNCDPDHDLASPGILLRDLDDDGRLDLVQGYHDDMAGTQPSAACNTGERKFGIFAWRNVSRDGKTRFEAPTNGLGGVGQMRWDAATQRYQPVSHGLGLPYIVAFDAFNTGRLDLLAVGPTDPTFHVQSDLIAGAFFANKGDMQFANVTGAVGLGSLNWTYQQWAAFYGTTVIPDPIIAGGCAIFSPQPVPCQTTGFAGTQIYGSSAVWGDFDNDGCVDAIVSDRHEAEANYGLLRNILYRNDCHGGFRPQSTQVSGLDTNSETLEAADMTGNGLLDLVAGLQPGNSFPRATGYLPLDRQYLKTYVNTGALGGRENHWVELRLTGLPDRMLTGSQLYLYGRPDGARLGRRELFSTDAYKAAHEPVAHWGLAQRSAVGVRVRLPGGGRKRYRLPCINRRLTIDVKTGRIGGCKRPQIRAERLAGGGRSAQDVRFTVQQPADRAIAGSQTPIAVAGARISVGGRRARTDWRGRATLRIRAMARTRITIAVPGVAARRLTLGAALRGTT